jgi:hypothetical protein
MTARQIMTARQVNPNRLPTSARTLTRYLDGLKNRFSSDETASKLALLARLRETEILDPRVLLQYHEALLFIRAYPDNPRVFSLACRECDSFADRVTNLRSFDPDAASELEDTGLVHTGMYYSYDYAVIIWLIKWYGDALDIDWDEFEETHRIDGLLPLFCEWVENDGLDLAEISTEEWIELRKGGRSTSSLRWLLENLQRAIPSFSHRMQLYDSLDLPIVWQLGNSPAARTHAGTRSWKPFYHQDGLLRKIRDFSQEIAKPLDTIRTAPPREANALIKTARSTLAVRHRALYPLDYVSRDEVLVAEIGRGYQIILFGMQPQRRLPIESDYGVLILKNGFVFGYGVGALLFDQVEIAVNIFDTWRGGESRFVFTQFVRVFRSHFGCSQFKIERYQVGYENDEGIQSGSFWFYYHLGFVPKLPEVRRLAQREQAKIDRKRSYRSPVSVLEKLAMSDLYLTLEGDSRSIPEDFPVADLGLKVTRMIGEQFDGEARKAVSSCVASVARALKCPEWRDWPQPEQESFRRLSIIIAQIPDLARWSRTDKETLTAIMRAKGKPQEAEFARLTARHKKLRRALEAVARQ